MKGTRIRKSGEIIEQLEERGAEVLDVDVSLINDEGMLSSLAALVGRPSKTPVVSVDFVIPDAELREEIEQTDGTEDDDNAETEAT